MDLGILMWCMVWDIDPRSGDPVHSAEDWYTRYEYRAEICQGTGQLRSYA